MAKKDKKWEPPAVRVTAAFSRSMKGKAASDPGPGPKVPTLDDAADSTKDLGNPKRKGYSSTILGGRQSAAAETVESARKTLLGA